MLYEVITQAGICKIVAGHQATEMQIFVKSQKLFNMLNKMKLGCHEFEQLYNK